MDCGCNVIAMMVQEGATLFDANAVEEDGASGSARLRIGESPAGVNSRIRVNNVRVV
jgi:hypothetical protein